MLQALGFSFMDKGGNEVPFGAYGVSLIDSVDISGAIAELKECKFHIACDVTNPLCGKNGCSHVYSRQKGADDEMIEKMDTYLENYAEITEKALNISTKNAEGAGAAGGLGFAFISYLNASLEKGIKLIIEKTGLENKIKDADLVVTGEGRLDFQTAMGKAPVGVAEIAQKYGVTTIAFAGCVTNDAGECNNHGIKAFFPILREICTLDKAMDKEYARNNLEKTAEQVFRLMK
jgi:glycerate kinase